MRNLTHGNESYSFRQSSSRDWNARRGYNVTRKSDGAKAFFEDHPYRSGKLSESWIAQFASATFQVPKVVVRRPRSECQLCTKEQALTGNGRLGNHGYSRPGWGFIVGNCPGVGYKPFPATDALEAIVPRLNAHLTWCESQVIEPKSYSVHAGRNDTREVTTFAGYEALSTDETIARSSRPGTYRDLRVQWDELVKRTKANWAREAKRTEEEIVWVTERIAKGKALRATLNS